MSLSTSSFIRRSPTPRDVLVAIVAIGLLAIIAPLSARPADAQGTAPLVINEFVASNQSGLVDATGEPSDWIELHNPTSSTVRLTGWTIADGGGQFVFTQGSISPGGYLIIRASDDPTQTTPAELHLPFKLSANGEALTLRNPAGTLSTPAWSATSPFPAQQSDVSYGLGSDGALYFFEEPTPGAQNASTGLQGTVAPPTFSVAHGFYASAQTVVLDTATPGATIRYTIDGSTPTASNGTALAPGQSVTVNATTVLRAGAFRDSWLPSLTETRSYLFADDIVNQSETPPLGWPADASINNMRAFYGIDSDLSQAQRNVVANQLTAVPSISLSTDLDSLFDPATGIWTNPFERGTEWERPVSVELIDPTGAQPGFEINAGLRIRGNSSRELGNFKHSMRLVFDDDYGDGELNYALFGAEGVDVFESVDLKTAQSWSWQRPLSAVVNRGTEATWLRDLWNLDTQGAMGQPYARSRFVHVYINGQYWGLHMTEERVSNQHGAQYLGGDEADFDIIKRDSGVGPFATRLHVEARDGTLDDWLELWALVEDHQLTNAEWATFKNEVDVVNLADYYLLSFFSGDSDGTPRYTKDKSNNWLALRNRAGEGAGAKWMFNDRDSESALCTDTNAARRPDWDPTPPWNLDGGIGADFAPENYLAPAWLFEAALTQPEFVRIFQDRVQLHMLTPGGALTIPESIARLDSRAAVLDLVIDAESARWGDSFREPAFDRNDWEQAVAKVRDCFALRTEVIETYFREDGLWPTGPAPVIAPASGAIDWASQITIDRNGQAGTLWYTTDGSDPASADGTVAASAQSYAGPISMTDDVTITARTRFQGTWTPLAQATYSLAGPVGPVRLIVNEYNAVADDALLGNLGDDPTLGRVVGNGGDWIELVVLEDNVDLTGWSFEISSEVGNDRVPSAVLTFADDPLLQNLLAGTIITISESQPDDVSYLPAAGDWHINLQANNADQGQYITAGSQTDFTVDHNDAQIAIYDALSRPTALRTGEGTAPRAGVSSTEVFKLEANPTAAVAPDGDYNDGSSSTWGLPNTWLAGTLTQDFSGLRAVIGDVNCDGVADIIDSLFISQFDVFVRPDGGRCPVATGTLDSAIGDVNRDGITDVIDALFISQCDAFVPNISCPNP